MIITQKYHFPLYMFLAGIIPILIGTILFAYSETNNIFITSVFIGTGVISIIPIFGATGYLCSVRYRTNIIELNWKFAIQYIIITLIMLIGFVLIVYSIILPIHGYYFGVLNVVAVMFGILFVYTALSEFPIGKIITLDINKNM